MACKGKGYITRVCPNEPVCYDCLQSGLINGSPLCPATEEMGMNGEDTDNLEESQTETADNETSGKDSSSQENKKKQVTSDEVQTSTQTLDSSPSS